MLAWWVVYRRDPIFANRVQTKINPIWCRRTIEKLSRTYSLELVSLGEDLFLERLKNQFTFDTQVVANSLRGPISMLTRVNRGNWIGRLIVTLQGHYPIYLTIQKA